MKRGVWFGLAGMLAGVLFALGPAVSARASVVGPQEQCNESGRQVCITLSTFANITASDATRPSTGSRYTWVAWSLRNKGGSTLTNVAATVQFCDAGTSSLGPSCPSTDGAAFVDPLPAGCSRVSATKLQCTYGNLAAGAPTATRRAYFKTGDLPATSTDIAVTASAKEGPNDAKTCNPATDPNCDTFTSTITNSYEPEPDAAYTFTLAGNKYHLEADDALSSFGFAWSRPDIFFSYFKVHGASTTYCFGSVPCFDRTLEGRRQNDAEVPTEFAGFDANNPVVYYARLPDPPNGVTDKNLTAIHTYDAMTFTAASNRVTGPLPPAYAARMDGLWLQDPAFGLPAAKYYIVNYRASDNSFQLQSGLGKGFAPLTLTDGAGPANAIRIIGDQSDERTTTGCQTLTAPSAIPSICAKKVAGSKALDMWVWDAGNGYMQG